MKENWDRASMRFASVGYLARQRMIAVTFENGDHFLIATESGLPASTSLPPNWAKMRIGETGDVIEVPTLGATIEIPWDRIRSVADPDFRAHLAHRAAERARHIGARIRTMRLEAGLTRAAVAEKVGVTREMLANLEAGQVEPQTNLIENIANALGKRLQHFAEESPRRRQGRKLHAVKAE